MNILILGGGGLIGQRVATALGQSGRLRGCQIAKLVLADLAQPASVVADFHVETTACDLRDPAAVASVLTADIDVIFLFAAVVSAHAESDFDTGYATNVQGLIHVLDRARALQTCPVVIFTSSIVAFGGDVPLQVDDQTLLNPQTSYGTQKAIGELLINDYSRKGFIDGRGFRLPTISVRPGKPNRAASGFMSSIFREPLSGQDAVCPVDPDFAAYYLSPRRCVANLIKGAELAATDLGQNRCMTMPGRMWTIAQMIAAMTDVAGSAPAERIRFEKDPQVADFVGGWRADIHADKALSLGMEADASFADNIRYFLEDDLPPKG